MGYVAIQVKELRPNRCTEGLEVNLHFTVGAGRALSACLANLKP